MQDRISIPSNAVDEDLIINNARRIPVCICIEKSVYTRPKINEIRNSMNKLKKAVMDDPHTFCSVEMCIIIFSDRSVVYKEFSLFKETDPEDFSDFEEQFRGAKEITNPDLCGALELAVRLLKLRKSDYRLTGKRDSFPARLMLLGSGQKAKDISRIAEVICGYGKSLEVWPICVSDKDFSWENYKCLRKDGKVFKASDDISKLFDDVGKSLAELSSSSATAFDSLKANAKGWEEYK